VRQPPAPWIAVPTTAGTGSEVTRNAVLADPGTGTKASLRHPSLVATVALLDPTVTHSLPPDVTARTGLDALIQLIEPYVSRRAHPMIDPLALDGIRRAAVALPRAYADGGDAAAREDLLLAALLSGIALAHCGLGISHAFAGPLGGSYPVPHGLACAATLPSGMAANLSAAARAAPDVPGPGGAETVRRYADVARALGAPAAENELATARAGVDHVRSLCRRLAIPPLGAFGVTRRAIPDLVARARLTSSMKANPVELDDAAMADVLAQAIG
jgi:alcohol dehydrogenase class IV